MRRIGFAFVILASLWMALPASADNGRREEALKRIEMLRIWRLTEVLNLSAEDGAKLFPALRKYDAQFQNLGERKEKALRGIQIELTKDKPDDEKLKSLMADTMSLEDEAMDVRKKMYKELQDLLTPDQLARYLIFEIKFQAEIEEIINQVRRESWRSKGLKKKSAPEKGQPQEEPSGQ